MIRLYDWYNEATVDLDQSLEQADISSPILVINETGFLPKGVLSPYAYFSEMASSDGKPLYFNQLPHPDFWEISGNNHQAEVMDYDKKRAIIYYAKPSHQRLIQNVDWLDEAGKVRYTDHYNQYGWRFAQTSFTETEEPIQKTYFNRNQVEIITEHVKTGDIFLNWQKKTYHFKGRVPFILFFLQEAGYDTSALWINSLSTPFFVSLALPRDAKKDILFWQEGLADQLPGNMQSILNNENGRIQTIVIQDKAVYEKALALAPDKAAHFVYLPPIYAQKETNASPDDYLILTNSDQIEQLETLVAALPDKTFHIAALTEMSDRLSAYAARPNVTLYPNVHMEVIERLFKQCGVYLDINHGSEILSATRLAYEHQLMLFAFNNTIHAPQLIPIDQQFEPAQVSELLARLKQVTSTTLKANKDQAQAEVHSLLRIYQEQLIGE